MKALRYQEDLKSNLNVLQEQIKFRKDTEKFEKDASLNQAKIMNRNAEEELEKETKRNREQRMKRIKHKDDLKNQGKF